MKKGMKVFFGTHFYKSQPGLFAKPKIGDINGHEIRSGKTLNDKFLDLRDMRVK